MGVSKIFHNTNLFVYLVEGDAGAKRLATLRRRTPKRGGELLTATPTLG